MLHFPQHDHKHVQAVLKFQSPYFNWATDPILQFFPQKTHLQGYISHTPGNTPVHTHRNFDPRALSHHQTKSTSICLSENLSYEFIIISVFSSSIFDYEFDYNFSGRKQPSILHLLLFPMKQQHCLYPVCQSSTYAHIISAVSPQFLLPKFLLCPTRFF